jgi:hypothetical protein
MFALVRSESDLPCLCDQAVDAVAEQLWVTPWHRASPLPIEDSHALQHVVLLPAAPAGCVRPDERLLHVCAGRVYIQRRGVRGVEDAPVQFRGSASACMTIRAWVVTPHGGSDDSRALLLLDRIMTIDGSAFHLTDLVAHAALMDDMLACIESNSCELRIETMWRGLAVAAAQLWTMAQTQLPYACVGLRLEQHGAPSPASDRVWLSSTQSDGQRPPSLT